MGSASDLLQEAFGAGAKTSDTYINIAVIYENTEGRQNLQREQKQVLSGLNVGNHLAGSKEEKIGQKNALKKATVVKPRLKMPINTAL